MPTNVDNLDSPDRTPEEEYNLAKNILVNKLSGIEGIPYQFMDTVDMRVSDTQIGRKYAEKIIARIPLLFLTPCEPVFMDDFNDMDRSTVANFLFGDSASDDLINGKGRYYSVEYAYADYYQYLQCMLTSVISYLGLYDEKISLDNKSPKSLGTINWQEELNGEFKTFFSASENVIFYLDGMTEISESYSNDTTESSLASMINGFADQANEIKFLFGKGGGVVGNLVNSASEVTSAITSGLSGGLGDLGGGLVGSLADKGVSTILNGGKIVFPKIWADSSRDVSYNINIKLRSPDHDSLSIFLNVLKPYCKLLCLVMSRQMGDNPNGYRAPFMVKGFCKGLFNIDYGMITSMEVTKGAECCWNDDGLPTQIDISLTIADLYSHLSISSMTDKKSLVVSNTAYMDFLANMAGLNIAQMEIGRRIKMYYYLTRSNFNNIPSRIFTRFDQNISKIMGSIYDRLS